MKKTAAWMTDQLDTDFKEGTRFYYVITLAKYLADLDTNTFLETYIDFCL